MKQVGRTDLLFLGLRLAGVLLFLSACTSTLSFVLWFGLPASSNRTFNESLTSAFVAATLSFWLFFFPDKTAVSIQRRVGDSLSASAVCYVGVLLASASAVGLPLHVGQWMFIRKYDPAPAAPWFVYGVLPNDLVVASDVFMILGGVGLFLVARPVTDWTDRERRRAKEARRELELRADEDGDPGPGPPVAP